MTNKEEAIFILHNAVWLGTNEDRERKNRRNRQKSTCRAERKCVKRYRNR